MPAATKAPETKAPTQEKTDKSTEATAETPEPKKKERVKLPPLKLDGVQASLVAPEETAKRRRTVNRDPEPRKAAQQSVDSLVEQTYDAWVKAGKPAKWNDRPSAVIRISSDQAKQLRQAVYNGALFIGRVARFGEVREFTDNGKPVTEFTFTIIDRPVKGEKAAVKE